MKLFLLVSPMILVAGEENSMVFAIASYLSAGGV
jgi:hypothetical protein